jgi:alpha-tubulin suppressor-like RCC1 family protein
VLSNGRARCWGANWDGRLGYGSTAAIGDDEAPSTAGNVPIGGDVLQIAAGATHTCALLATGRVRCWGMDAIEEYVVPQYPFGPRRVHEGRGVLGHPNGHAIGDAEPASAAGDVNVGGTVVQIAAGAVHTCVLLDSGNVRCWGIGDGGALGYGNTNDIGDDEDPASAGDVPLGGPVRQISASNYHTCALMETGNVRCWGYAWEWPQGTNLGYGNINNIGDNELPSSAGDVAVGGSVVQVAAGGTQSCAVLSSGQVRCWGWGGGELLLRGWTSGALGYGSTSSLGDNELPSTAGDVPVGGLTQQVATGAWHSCALLAGAVRCWGEAQSGTLGYGNPNDIGDNETPASAGNVNVGGSVVQLVAGGAHTCALLTGDRVRCWGSGDVLGYGNTNTIGDDELPYTAGDVPLK